MNCGTSIPASEVVEARATQTCPAGHDIPADAPMGLCSECLFVVALEAPQELKRIGEYDLLGEIGRGGMGVVYKARHIRAPQHTVALKMIRSGELASDDEVFRFHREDVGAAIDFKHPNIVSIYHVGEDEGRHYFTMEFMAGGSVADHIDRYRGDPRGTAEFVAIIAMAVHYAHQRGILHRDLKPANILLDGEGKPYVADFGVAKRIDRKSSVRTYPGAVVGTPSYMAPEQADPRGKILTTAADVYSLGVILYELLTGRCPFDGDDAGEIIEKVLHSTPPDPRTLEPGIDLDLATLCLRCLEKDPANRYQSAEVLAHEIQRYLNGEPIAKVGRIERAWRWCKREPFKAAFVVECLLLLVVATLAVFSGAAAQEEDRREEVLRANGYAARWVAGTVLFKLNSYHDVVANAARDFPPQTVALLRYAENRSYAEFEQYCHGLFERYGSSSGRAPFNHFIIRDSKGRARGRWPAPHDPADYFMKNYDWRDYFKGAWKLAEAQSRSAYISRAVLSEHDQTWAVAISAPIYDENGEPVGIIAGMTQTGAALGTLELKDPSDNRHIAMIVAPRDNDRETRDNPPPKDHVILIHDSLPGGKTAFLKNNVSVRRAVDLAESSNPNRGLLQLLLADPNAVTSEDGFCDPVMDGQCEDEFGKTRPGRWLAGFAPIGNTGFVAIVETPREAAARPNQTLARRLLLWGVLPFMVGTALVSVVVGFGRRRSKRADRPLTRWSPTKGKP